MTQDTIKKAYKDLLIVVSYFRMVPNMISYLPESSRGNVRDVTIRVVEALDRINEFMNKINQENVEHSIRS